MGTDAQLQAAIWDKLNSADPAEQKQAIDALTDFTRVTAREHGLQLPRLLIDGVIPVYESDFGAPRGEARPNLRYLIRDRVWASPFAIPDPYGRAYGEVADKRSAQVTTLLRDLVARATAAVLASQDKRIATLILSTTYSRLQFALEDFLKQIPWTPAKPAVDDDDGS